MIHEIYKKLLKFESVDKIKTEYKINDDQWQLLSKKIYEIHFKEETFSISHDYKNKNISSTSNKNINEMIKVNEILISKAICIPQYGTMRDYEKLKLTITNNIVNESLAIESIKRVVMSKKIRASQQKGCFEEFEIFSGLTNIIESSVISYYRGNYISAYLTILPVFEGVILRWMNKYESVKKPNFQKIKKFIGRSFERQPCPANIHFHNLYLKAVDKILNNHLYKPDAEVDNISFNRHISLHMNQDLNFNFKSNTIRSFLLLDIISELYRYETYTHDPVFSLSYQKLLDKINAYTAADHEFKTSYTPEHILG